MQGDTALHHAAWHGYYEIVQILLKYGANKYAVGNNVSASHVYRFLKLPFIVHTSGQVFQPCQYLLHIHPV